MSTRSNYKFCILSCFVGIHILGFVSFCHASSARDLTKLDANKILNGNLLAQIPPPPPPPSPDQYPLVPNPKITIDSIPPNYIDSNQSQLEAIKSESKTIKSGSNQDFNLGTTLGVGFESIDNIGGFGVNLGIEARYSNFTASLDIVDMLVTSSPASGFYRSQFSNGQSRCRNASSGRFASNSSCASDYNYNFRFFRNIDLTYNLPIATGLSIFGGIGTDLSDLNNLYPIVGLRLGETLNVKGRLTNNGSDIRVNFIRQF